jgi:hypothetical protein
MVGIDLGRTAATSPLAVDRVGTDEPAGRYLLSMELTLKKVMYCTVFFYK